MDRSYEKFNKAFDILGRKWNGLIIGYLLDNGETRFGLLADAIPDCSDRILTLRLKELEAAGIIKKQTINQRNISYSLTIEGEAMAPIMKEVDRWSDKFVK